MAIFRPQPALFGMAILESIFYGALRCRIDSIQRVAITHIHAFQDFFNIANVAAILFYARNLGKTPLGSLASIFISFVGGVLVVAPFLRKLSPPLFLEGNLTLSETFSLQQVASKILHVTKLALIALAIVFLPSPGLFFMTGCLLVYSLRENASIKWLHFSRSISDQGYEEIIKGFRFEYTMLVSNRQVPVAEVCTICQEPAPDTTFCIDHFFHAKCIASNMPKDIEAPSISCPNCREMPLQNTAKIFINRKEGSYDLTNEIQHTLEFLGRAPAAKKEQIRVAPLLYSLSQALWIRFVSDPDLTEKVVLVQKLLVATNFCYLGYNLKELYFRIKSKFQISPKKKDSLKLALAVASAATGALSYFILWRIQTYLKPIMPIASHTFSISWSTPSRIYLGMQAIIASHMISQIALMFFSTRKNLLLLESVAQLATLISTCRFRWIEATKMFGLPLEEFAKEVATMSAYVNRAALRDLKSLSTL